MNICEKPWPILKAHLSGVITVTEEEVIAAMRTVSLQSEAPYLIVVVCLLLFIVVVSLDVGAHEDRS